MSIFFDRSEKLQTFDSEKMHIWHPVEKNLSMKFSKKEMLLSVWSNVHNKVDPPTPSTCPPPEIQLPLPASS